MSATGDLVRFVPAGDDRDRLLRLVRLGQCFAAQQRGRRPAFMTKYIERLVADHHPRTFHELMVQIRFEALLTRQRGHGVIVEVDSEAGTVAYLDPDHGMRDVSLKRLRNLAALRKKSPA